ncbi:MAG: UDP-N-acetylglucosamine 1-carboxyvinyltransferase, partial [Clostridia bacterium]|nr:UDP-N-acetylglucosamine 1-carboxyvinyltransferase [Clostridia bacterium]
DLHLSGLEKLGVKIIKRHSLIYCDARNMASDTIQLDFPSVGATENLMMSAIFLKGTTKLINVAKEPEIVDLQNFLNSMGADVSGAGTAEITIVCVDKLHSTQYTPISDRIVEGTLMIATAITGGNVTLKNANFENNQSLIAKLSSVGCQIDIKSDIINITSKGRPQSIDLIDTQVYPGFPTDMQAQIMSLQSISNGVSIICENVFENRYKHAKELIKMGANIILRDRVAVVKGVECLTGAPVEATDLRAGAGLVLAGLKANGYTTISNVYHIDRGYDQLENILAELGANIKRI